MAVILQPAGSREANRHFIDTVENPVSIMDEEIRSLLGPTLAELSDLSNSNSIAMWGATPTEKNRGKYDRVKVGDRVLFSGKGRIFATANVAMKFENDHLARHLWGLSDSGTGPTWSLMFALEGVKVVDIPYSEFNRAVGYKDNFVIQGFNILSEERSQRFEAAFFLEENDTDRGASSPRWSPILPPSWLLTTFGGDHSQTSHAGNLGYDDIPGEVYRYDSKVPGSKQLKEGDIVVLRSKKEMIGVSRIERIETSPGRKQLNKCPFCKKTTGVKKRKTRRPRFRCEKCKEEFEYSLEEMVDVTNYSAFYDSAFLVCDSIPLKSLISACKSPKSQLSIRRMSTGKLIRLLMDTPNSDFSSFLSDGGPPPDGGGDSPPSDGGGTEADPETDREDDDWGDSGIVVSIEGNVVEEVNEIVEDEGTGWVGVTEDMIPKFSEYEDLYEKEDNRLECRVDDLAAKVFIDDARRGIPKIIIIFSDHNPTWPNSFSTKYFDFKEPGIMLWGHYDDSMRVLTRSGSGGPSGSSEIGEFSMVLSKNQYKKGSINANESIVTPLRESGLVDFSTIEPGKDSKVIRPCTLLIGEEEILTDVVFRIPKRRSEISRENILWPYGLKKITRPGTELFFKATESMLFIADSIEKL